MGVHLDASPQGGVSRLEVIEGPTGRRRRSHAERAQIAAESLMPGVRVADVARKHGTTRWQIYDWRKQIRNGRLVLPERLAALPPPLLRSRTSTCARCGARRRFAGHPRHRHPNR